MGTSLCPQGSLDLHEGIAQKRVAAALPEGLGGGLAGRACALVAAPVAVGAGLAAVDGAGEVGEVGAAFAADPVGALELGADGLVDECFEQMALVAGEAGRWSPVRRVGVSMGPRGCAGAARSRPQRGRPLLWG